MAISLFSQTAARRVPPIQSHVSCAVDSLPQFFMPSCWDVVLLSMEVLLCYLRLIAIDRAVICEDAYFPLTPFN